MEATFRSNTPLLLILFLTSESLSPAFLKRENSPVSRARTDGHWWASWKLPCTSCMGVPDWLAWSSLCPTAAGVVPQLLNSPASVVVIGLALLSL